MTTPEIRGLIFDMDGVIANTDELHFQTWMRLAKEEDVAFSREKYLRMSGVGHKKNAITFTENLDVDTATIIDWMARKQQYYAELRETLQPSDAMPGVVSLIAQVKQAGLKLGVGSSSRNAKPVLEKLELIDEFEVVGDGHTVTQLKPEPDIFLWVAGALRLKPQHCLVLEDAPAGIEAAKRAGCYVVGTGDRDLSAAHAQLASLEGVTLSDLLNLL